MVEYIVPIVSESDDGKIRRLHNYLENRDGHVNDQDVIAAFEIPYSERKRSALDRVLTEKREFIHENRCLRCHRLLRTPVARQCLWCGHDWH